ncbi:NAD(P)/FAD-dependent oxidoreductase [Luteimonas sp. 3794]|uniref:NAD(P)/FAD-dependent oxidoreductase n=1 Tax=Luteimonas sp. 3794 TaxID=2817730 RepID=UPI00285424AC|nr:NAD(P)/FAD-dependent oxidoreductase [Luteimonas sp. 3794]MDR6992132.1 thioredoxin reductase [Luteimonas sp. 3794]
MRYDAVIVGGGSAGLSAAQALARARRQVLVVDAGQPRNRFAAAVHNVFGHDDTPPAVLLAKGRAELHRYPTATVLTGEVIAATAEADGFSLALADGQALDTRTLILAGGVRDVLPPLEGLQARWGRSVLHCPYCHGFELGGRALGAFAGEAMGLHRALMLPDWGPTTCFLEGGFEPDAEDARKLANRGVVLERVPVVALLGTAPALDGVRLADGREVGVKALFVGARIEPVGGLAEALGCAQDPGPQGPYLRVDAFKQTTVPGVFAAGDLSQPMHSVPLAIASGLLAGVGAHQALIAADAA